MKNITERTLATGTHNGYDWRVSHNGLGYRCGYVKLPDTSPYYAEHYDDIPVDCHGGLTYAAKEDSGYWIGFDCMHLEDARDSELPCACAFFDRPDEVIRTTEYCVEQCKHIIDQLIKLP